MYSVNTQISPYICLVWSVFAIHAHISAWSGQSLQSTLINLPGLVSLRSPRPYICLVCSVFAVHAHISAWSGQSSQSTPIYLPGLLSLRSPHPYICLVWSVFAVHAHISAWSLCLRSPRPYICLVWSVFAVHAHISAWSAQSSQSTPIYLPSLSAQSSQSTPIYLPSLLSLRSPRPYICLGWSVFAVHAHISAWSGQSSLFTPIYLPGLVSLRSPRSYICRIWSVFAVHAHISAWSGQSSLSTCTFTSRFILIAETFIMTLLSSGYDLKNVQRDVKHEIIINYQNWHWLLGYPLRIQQRFRLDCLECVWPSQEVIKLFSCSTQLSMKFSLLINMKMPTIVGIFSSAEQHSQRAIALPSVLALASASTNVKVFVKVFKTSKFSNLITDLIHLWYDDTYWSKILPSFQSPPPPSPSSC